MDGPGSVGFWDRQGDNDHVGTAREPRPAAGRSGRDVNPLVVPPNPLSFAFRQVMDEGYDFMRNLKLQTEHQEEDDDEETILSTLFQAAFGDEGEARLDLRDRIGAELGEL